MNPTVRKVLYGLCSSSLALALYLGTSSISILFFGEPEFPTEK